MLVDPPPPPVDALLVGRSSFSFPPRLPPRAPPPLAFAPPLLPAPDDPLGVGEEGRGGVRGGMRECGMCG